VAVAEAVAVATDDAVAQRAARVEALPGDPEDGPVAIARSLSVGHAVTTTQATVTASGKVQSADRPCSSYVRPVSWRLSGMVRAAAATVDSNQTEESK